MKKDNRHEFLKMSLLGLSGAALAPGAMNGYHKMLSSELIVPELPVRTLGRTGIQTPLISMGGAEASTPSFVRAAYEAGTKLFFSATYFGEGKNEQLVGEGLKDLPRDSFVLGTAVPPDNFDNRTGKFKTSFDVDAYLRKAEGSLKRFGLDHVDIFLSARIALISRRLCEAICMLTGTGTFLRHGIHWLTPGSAIIRVKIARNAV
jgi:uncharacterized protein